MKKRNKYTSYMKSPAWAKKRRTYFKSKQPQGCQGCGTRKQLHLHHKTYERLGRERLTDLIPLCSKCHAEVHRGFESVGRKQGYDLWSWTEKAVQVLQAKKAVSRPVKAAPVKKLSGPGVRKTVPSDLVVDAGTARCAGLSPSGGLAGAVPHARSARSGTGEAKSSVRESRSKRCQSRILGRVSSF